MRDEVARYLIRPATEARKRSSVEAALSLAALGRPRPKASNPRSRSQHETEYRRVDRYGRLEPLVQIDRDTIPVTAQAMQQAFEVSDLRLTQSLDPERDGDRCVLQQSLERPRNRNEESPVEKAVQRQRYARCGDIQDVELSPASFDIPRHCRSHRCDTSLSNSGGVRRFQVAACEIGH